MLADAEFLSSELLFHPLLKFFMGVNLRHLCFTSYAESGGYRLDNLSCLDQLRTLQVESENPAVAWATQGLLSLLTNLSSITLDVECEIIGPFMQSLGKLLLLKHLSCSAIAMSIGRSPEHFKSLQRLILKVSSSGQLRRSTTLHITPKAGAAACVTGEVFGLLSQLSISDCTLVSAPLCLRLMPALTQVKFSFCQFVTSDWLNEALEDAIQLQSLRMAFCFLQEVPSSICQLYNLNKLNMTGNRLLRDLPLSMSGLKALKTLKVGGCSFEHVPVVLESLSSLQSVDITCNQVSMYVDRSLMYLVTVPDLQYVATSLRKREWDAISMEYLGQLASALEHAFIGGTTPLLFHGRGHAFSS